MPIKVHPVDLARVHRTLEAEGFEDTFWQRYEGQLFGLIKSIPPNHRMHVRAFGDGTLDSHREVTVAKIGHVLTDSVPADYELAQILNKYSIPHRVEDETTLMRYPNPEPVGPPWWLVGVIVGGLLVGLAALAGRGNGNQT